MEYNGHVLFNVLRAVFKYGAIDYASKLHMEYMDSKGRNFWFDIYEYSLYKELVEYIVAALGLPSYGSGTSETDEVLLMHPADVEKKWGVAVFEKEKKALTYILKERHSDVFYTLRIETKENDVLDGRAADCPEGTFYLRNACLNWAYEVEHRQIFGR